MNCHKQGDFQSPIPRHYRGFLCNDSIEPFDKKKKKKNHSFERKSLILLVIYRIRENS